MTRIAVLTRSAAVRQTLENIVLAAGHSLAAADDAELALCDTQHAPPNNPACPILHLVQGPATTEDEISCPLRPYQLAQKLLQRSQVQSVPLSPHWSLDVLSRTLKHADHASIPLTEKECLLLKTLAEAPTAAPLDRETLLTQVWGMAGQVDTHTLETHIYRLRSKLEGLAAPIGDIITEDGAYRWVSKN